MKRLSDLRRCPQKAKPNINLFKLIEQNTKV